VQARLWLGAVGAIAVVGVGLAVTSPSDQEFVSYAFVTLRRELCPRLPELLKEAQQDQALPEFLTPYLSQSCTELLTAIRGGVEDFLRRHTRVQNYVVFRIYTTELFGKQYRTLGIARQFITLPEN